MTQEMKNELWPWVRDAYLQMCMRQQMECVVTGIPIDMGSDVHHKMGRVGYADAWARENDIPLLLDVRYFLAVTRKGHQWIEDGANRKQALALGYIIPRSQTHEKVHTQFR